MSFAGAISGDLFLSFVGDKLSIDINYKNRIGLVSCFILRFMELENPVFVLKDFDLALGCQKAYIEPSFGELAEKRTLILKCALKNASFMNVEKKVRASIESLTFLKADITPLFDRLSGMLFDAIYTTLAIHDNTADFLSFEAYSEDVKINASGSVAEAGRIDIKIKVFFSAKITEGLPEEARAILTKESNGWRSYSLHIESGRKRPFFKLESDRFRINFEKIEKK